MITPIAALGQHLGAVRVVGDDAFSCCSCGLLATFVFAPGQALEARRVARMPQMDAAAPGDPVLISGVLIDNPPINPDTQLVAILKRPGK